MSDLIKRLKKYCTVRSEMSGVANEIHGLHLGGDDECILFQSDIEAAITALERMQWNPDMDAANKKSSIIAVDMSDMNTLALAKWRQHNGIWAWRNPDGFIIEATHWMNLPEGE